MSDNKQMLEALKSDIAGASGMWFEPISCFVVRKDNKNIRYQHRYDLSPTPEGENTIFRMDGGGTTDVFHIDTGLTWIVGEARGDRVTV